MSNHHTQEGISDKQIMRLFDKGSSLAMDALYRKYAAFLTGVCRRYIADEENLHDVLQESFIKIFTRIHQFSYRGEGSLKAWTARVVINEALQTLRSKQPAQFVDTPVENLNIEDEEPNAEGLSAETIVGLLRQLPAGYRAVFNLYVVEGKSHKEIAELLNIQPATSASQLFKAKNMLARMIREKRKEDTL